MRLNSLLGEQAWALIRSACTKSGADSDLLAALLNVHLGCRGDATRRRLYAEFDALFGEDADAVRPRVQNARELPSWPSTGSVRLRLLSGRNWTVFNRVCVDFPPHDPNRPIVLIGGQNGAGKTSLLKALIFGLFGSLALREFAGDSDRAPTVRHAAYRRAIESAFHRPARFRGESVMSVELAFDTPEGPLRIERRWYFGEDGSFVESEEELVLLVGEEADVLAVPVSADSNEFYQGEIARRLLPPALAPFLFFDGEQVERFGRRRLTDQVRLTLESLNGAQLLRDTASDLRDYARDRSRDAGPERGITEDTSAREIEWLESRETAILERLAELDAQVTPLRRDRDSLIAELGGLSGGTYAELQDLLEQQRRSENDEGRIHQALAAFSAEELPIYLASSALRQALAARLREEEADEARTRVSTHFSEVPEDFLRAFASLSPTLADREAELVARVRAAWEAWIRTTSRLERRHHYLTEGRRGGVLGRLAQVDDRVGARGLALADELSRCREIRQALVQQIERKRGDSERRTQLKRELDALSAAMDEKDAERRILDRELGEIQSTLQPRRAEARLRRERREAASPALRRAGLAILMAEAIDATIQAIAPAYTERLSRAVTSSYRELAHKEVVDRIEISASGEVVVLDRAGRPLQDLDASAGERQVFAMAMMAAVAELAGSSMPVVMDTPLGRLDPDHRERILRYCAARENQTVLLSHPDEIHGRYLTQIAERVATQFVLQHEAATDGPGESLMSNGYFTQATA